MTAKTFGLVKAGGKACQEFDLASLPREVTDWDMETYLALTCAGVTPEQARAVRTPPAAHPRQEYVLAVHWHPEQVPLDLIRERLEAMYPNARDQLIIPTQHNQIMTWDGYAGVEVDCYSHGFNRKVQLLVHLKAERVEQAGVLGNMLRHTFKYRSSQLFEYLDALCAPAWEERRQKAARAAGSDEEVVEFTAIHAARLREMLSANEMRTPEDAVKNKLVRNYLDCLREFYDDRLINKVQVYAKAVKEVVKENFSMAYFYRASEVIEEARSLGAGVVIPHPEQFWPILLRNYDVDGIEVWNPQSQQYTEFLISVVLDQNRRGYHKDRPLLIFMGDDCHMSEKLKKPEEQDRDKAAREVGLQPAWDDLGIAKGLIVAGVSRKTVMDEYRARLG
ncbi:hypothetical protein NNJEOMEG_03588 [Fundidesulfovibrio magnetotacticus]|uniref:Uncharacterized protein n=1 Tax=Fundidesulfovibrio magnetotacticus TaxID=2730080 RepID=A0A6V8LY13_9BACT|nr:hypothetical protein [Fundidesulfovibrio magnetotacticus]GFK95720.1 hypothetical protein NNJEOMEG_03588 [Fundidesulfovibrio magnetotacticus]